jgi:seryl-tRNA synthetase
MSSEVKLPESFPHELREELLKRLPYVSEKLVSYSLNETGEAVCFGLRGESDDEADRVAERIMVVVSKLVAGYREGGRRTLVRRGRSPAYRDDPHPALLNAGELFRFGRGRFGLGPVVIELVTSLDRCILEAFRELAPIAYQFPALIGADVLDRCRYLKNFPSSLSLVTHLREDLPLLQAFAEEAGWKDGALEFPEAAQSKVECLLAPSICFHWYAWMSGAVLRTAAPAITAIGKCFRYESSALEGLERLWDFTMREVVFVGPAEHVRRQRDRCIELSARLLDELELSYEISTATDPFFVDSFAVQAAFQQGFELKHELLTPLPYKDRLLAVGSVNFHQDFFGRSFQIEAQGRSAETACIGIGLERLALAVMAQHGTRPEQWPVKLREGMRAR